ncbi:MAG TPA: acyl-CoA dehydrogenase [Jatrophihabitans sp.]|jgi:alkylation response protein AidB-like acyl-CoA dehydrogenase|nr:acyl-CoA dehydrogenase [Jatrophihabitans sp.]
MDFTLSQDQRELKAAARHYLSQSYPPARIAELSDGAGWDSAAWPELVRQGWLDPELGAVELALLAEEGGRVLHPVPWWVTVALALPVYQAAGLDLPGPATLADGSTGCRALRQPTGWVLDGLLPSVPQAGLATEILVAARTAAGIALFAVDPDAPGLTLTERAGLDPLRIVAGLRLAGAPARLLLDAPAAEPVLASVERRAGLLLACEAVGVADRVLELAVDYAKIRTQFGRPIGSYQAVAHQLADSYAAVELARSLAYRAACVLDDEPGDAAEAIACAVQAGTRAAVSGCQVAMQVTGGIGVTWEYPLHRWYRRALFLQARAAAGPDPLAVIAGELLQAARPAPEPIEGALASA